MDQDGSLHKKNILYRQTRTIECVTGKLSPSFPLFEEGMIKPGNEAMWVVVIIEGHPVTYDAFFLKRVVQCHAAVDEKVRNMVMNSCFTHPKKPLEIRTSDMRETAMVLLSSCHTITVMGAVSNHAPNNILICFRRNHQPTTTTGKIHR